MIRQLTFQALFLLSLLLQSLSLPAEPHHEVHCFAEGQSPSLHAPSKDDCLGLAKNFLHVPHPDAPQLFSLLPIPEKEGQRYIQLPFSHSFGSCFITIDYADHLPPFYEITTWATIGKIVSDTADRCLNAYIGPARGSFSWTGAHYWLYVTVSGKMEHPATGQSNGIIGEVEQTAADGQNNDTKPSDASFSLRGNSTE